MAAHTKTLDLLNQAVAQGHSVEKQYQDLRGNNSIQAARAVAVDAAALALTSKTSRLAVELLEEGRGVIFRQLARFSAELGAVRAVEPTLAAKFEDLSRRLKALTLAGSRQASSRQANITAEVGVDDETETASATSRSHKTKGVTQELVTQLDHEDGSDPEYQEESPVDQSKDGGDDLLVDDLHHARSFSSCICEARVHALTNSLHSRYQDVLKEWTKVLDRIRKLSHFHSFLKPSDFYRLRCAAARGPVIIVNISQIRSDAFIIVSNRNSPISIPLPNATLESVERLADRLGLRPALLDKVTAIAILRETWRIIVQPIAEKLQDPQLGAAPGSRVWWCSTGAASRLPLHAAGPYKPNTPGMLELFVSSYTPSLEALIVAREEEREEEKEKSGGNDSPNPSAILVVSQPSTPGQEELPHVSSETLCIQLRAPTANILNDKAGTRADVLKAIVKCSWAHLICHGHHDPTHPFSSHFSMYDGSISLRDLLEQDLPKAQIAVLSACHSAKVNKELPDESLHLAAGLIAAGFRSVVATMWALDDEVGPLVMEKFYAEMLPEGGEAKKAEDVATALKKAVSMKKEGSEDLPLIPLMQRINFVHYGV